jgi:hypothetical protein
MNFLITPEEAQTTAAIVAARLAADGYSVAVEAPFSPDAPYRTTLLAKLAGMRLLIEAQGQPSYEPGLRDFALWLGTNRHYCELYVAVDRSAHVALDTMERFKRDGVGLILVESDGPLGYHLKARNPQLVISIDPGLALGQRRSEIHEIIDRYNGTDRKAAVRDMCDVVERETKALIRRAQAHGWLTISEAGVEAMDWSSAIDALHSAKSYGPGKAPLLDDKTKTDLHSFRGARNLVDHPARTKSQDLSRQRQYPERMMMGPRLTAELLSIRRRVR